MARANAERIVGKQEVRHPGFWMKHRLSGNNPFSRSEEVRDPGQQFACVKL
jgi:hypothetical protein